MSDKKKLSFLDRAWRKQPPYFKVLLPFWFVGMGTVIYLLLENYKLMLSQPSNFIFEIVCLIFLFLVVPAVFIYSFFIVGESGNLKK